MRIIEVLTLVIYALGMTAGQLMFKAASTNSRNNVGDSFVFSLIFNFWFIAAAVLYAALTVMWVWILTFLPLSRAYPFVILSFVLTPLGAALFYGEILTTNYVIGMLLIITGLGVLIFKGA